MRHLEDFVPGQVFELGEAELTEADILRVGREFDPQPFHIDPVAARNSPFGGLIASGWHTGGIAVRLLVQGLMLQTANLGGLGIDDVHFTVPVRPGDRLTGRATVVEARPSRSKPDRGVLGLRLELENQRGELAWTGVCWSLVARRG